MITWTNDAWEMITKNRIVYKIEGDIVKIVQCGTHYGSK